jgi:plastocyanin
VSTRTGLRAIAVAGLLLASSLIAMPASNAATTLKVPVGAPLFALPEANGTPADGMRFYAPPLSVHKNDVILFSMQGFHSATLLPTGVDADQWVAGNALGFGKPYSLSVPDPDEGPAGVKVNNAVALPPASGCGVATNPCSYDGSQIVNSGLFPQNPNSNEFDFSVTINADAGKTFTVLCLVHLAMRLDITVVADTETTTTQEGIDAFATQKYARDARRASRLHQELLATVRSSGRGVLDAFVGYDGAHFALDTMYPKRLDLHKGQRVRWHFDQLIFEDHTVTFPQKKGQRIANNSFVPVCDPDGDAGAMPDETANLDATDVNDVCPGGVSQIELDIDPRSGPPAGDGVVTSTRDFESSGVAGANAGVTAPYTLKFARRTTSGPYTFVCIIHPFMHGKVVVG